MRHIYWPTTSLADRSSTKVGRVLFCSTSKRHLEMSLSCCSHRLDRTRHTSAVCLLFLLFSVELFQLQNHLSSKYIYHRCSDLSLMHLSSSLMPSLIQRSVRRRCRLLLVAFFAHSSIHVRFGRSSCSVFFPNPYSSSAFFSRSPCCNTSRFYPFFYYLGFRFACYRCILRFITSHAPSYAPFRPSPPASPFLVRFHLPSSCFTCSRLRFTFPISMRCRISAILRLSLSLVDETHAFYSVDRSRAHVSRSSTCVAFEVDTESAKHTYPPPLSPPQYYT